MFKVGKLWCWKGKELDMLIQLTGGSLRSSLRTPSYDAEKHTFTSVREGIESNFALTKRTLMLKDSGEE